MSNNSLLKFIGQTEIQYGQHLANNGLRTEPRPLCEASLLPDGRVRVRCRLTGKSVSCSLGDYPQHVAVDLAEASYGI